MARRYTVTFENVTTSAAQDLVTIIGAANKVLRIIGYNIQCTTQQPTSQQIQLRCRTLPATLTAGSGGTTPTPQKLSPGDAAASFTAHVNDTVKATTNGTAIIQRESAPHLFAGEEYMWPTPPEIIATAGFVIELLTAPTGTCALTGTCTVEELG